MSAERWMKELEMLEKVRKHVRAKEKAQAAEQEKIRQAAEERAWRREIDAEIQRASQSAESCSNHCKEVEKKMKENIKEKLSSYLELLDEIKQRTQDERAAVSLLQEISKDRRMDEIRKERNSRNDLPATDKQISFLESFGVPIPVGLTRKQASNLIENAKAAVEIGTKAGKVPIRMP